MIGGAAGLLDERSVWLCVSSRATATMAAGGRPMRKGFMFLTGARRTRRHRCGCRHRVAAQPEAGDQHRELGREPGPAPPRAGGWRPVRDRHPRARRTEVGGPSPDARPSGADDRRLQGDGDPLGDHSEWARNVLAAGHCRLQLRDVVYELDDRP